MRKDISNTWNGDAILVKGKDNQYFVVHYYENSYNQCFVTVYDADKHGVAKSHIPLKHETYDGERKDKFEDVIKEYEYIPKKERKKKAKKTTKDKKKKSNVKTKKQTKRTSTKKTKQTKTSTSKKKDDKKEEAENDKR